MRSEKPKCTPRFADWLIERLIGAHMLEELKGDLQEIYEDRLSHKGQRHARLMYLVDALHLIYGFSSVNIFKPQNNTSMVKHNLKIVFRNLYRDVRYSLINIFGLATSITCCIILGLYLHNELTYDRHFEGHENIYRIASELTSGQNINEFAQTSYALGPLIAEESPEIQSFVRLREEGRGYALFQYEDIKLRWEDIYTADDNVFEFFKHDIIYGNPETALQNPGSMAVNQSFARAYFGDRNPVGQTIKGELGDYMITLVFADLPGNTHLKYNALITYKEHEESVTNPTNTEPTRHSLWYNRSNYTYVRMPAGYSTENFETTSSQFFDKYMSQHPDRYNSSVTFSLEKLDRIHLYSNAQRDQPHGNRFYIAGFIGIGVFVLLVACINYMNLSTARFSRRTKDIIIPQVLGARRAHLVWQLLTESVVFVMIALLLSIGLSHLLLENSSLNTLFNKQLTIQPLFHPMVLAVLFGAVLAMGLLAGVYPSVYLSRFKPVGKIKTSDQSVRKGLVFVQFLVSICVISCTVLMYYQMKFIQQKSLGFDKENKVTLTIQGSKHIENIPLLANELKQNSNVLEVTESRNQMGRVTAFEQAEVENNEGEFVAQSYNWFYIDEHFVNAMDIDIVQGRNFDPDITTDPEFAILVNETLVRKMGWTDPIGKRLRYEAGQPASRVIGVMKDFHFHGLQHEIESMIFWLASGDNFNDDWWNDRNRALVSRVLTVSLRAGTIEESLAFLEEKWNEFDQEHPFEFQFLDDKLNQQYDADMRQMKLIGLFSGLCILISCLGLLGLTAFNVEQRTKEIGVRKVLGASAWQIIGLLFKNILISMAIATVIASGLSYMIMEQWLQGFYYHDEINLMAFIIAAVMSIMIAFTTIAGQSFKTARANPVKALRFE